jgi:NAD(P)H-hydrate epimerase
MKHSGTQLYDIAAVRELDRRAIRQYGVPGAELMQRAAAAAWREARRRWPAMRSLEVFCGSGNNGGDGYALASLARAEGFRVQVRQVGAPPSQGDARSMHDDWIAGAVADEAPDDDVQLVVDAIFGIGLSRAPAGEAFEAIESINARRAAGSRVLALDIPSGLDADTGSTPGVAVIADLTVTFIGDKIGLHTARGPDLCGAVVVDALGIPDAVTDGIEPVARLIDAEALRHWLPQRRRSAHKGDNGHVLLIGGDHGTPRGAARRCRPGQRGHPRSTRSDSGGRAAGVDDPWC